MELNKGFKQTDIGWIPKDWEVKKLSDLTSMVTNGFVGTVKSQYTDSGDGITYIQGYNVEENSFNFRGIKKVTPEFHKQHQKSCLMEGDLLTIQTGDVGLTSIVPKELVGANCHALIITRFKKNTSNPRFYSCLFNSKIGRARLKEIETGTTMKHINVGDLLHFLVPTPPLPEQTAIANALSDTDALLSSLDTLLTKKRNLKQAAMQRLLEPGEGWVVRKLGEMAFVATGNTPSTRDQTNYGEEFFFIGPTDLGKGNYILSSEKKLSKKGFESSRKFPKNSILYSCIGTIGKSGIAREELTSNQQINAIFPNDRFNTNYLFYMLNHLTPQIKSLAGEQVIPIVNKKQFEGTFVPFPPLNEQTRIATILSDIDCDIEALEKKIAKYKGIKTGMIQNLLTGKIRLI
jgi:type I restriction enzyme S subunit